MINHVNQLSAVGQDFVDAVALNNGSEIKAIKPTAKSHPASLPEESDLWNLWDLIKVLDPDMGYDDWLRVGMAIFYATKGSDKGLALFDKWSAQGSKYNGLPEIEKKWYSFDPNHENPVTIGTLIWMIQKGVGVRDD